MKTQSSAIYGLAFIGALIYFLQHATGFWDGALGRAESYSMASGAGI